MTNSPEKRNKISNNFMNLNSRCPDVRGYSERNIRNMKKFYGTYKKLQSVVAELLFKVSWTNHVIILNKTI